MNSNLIADKIETTAASAWRAWIWIFLGTMLILFPALYLAVLVIDPFSTGRFALTQQIDFTTRNVRLGRAGLVRDLQFNGAIFGSSTAFPLDPSRAAAGTGWRLAQLSIPAALPPDQMAVARAFERRRHNASTLTIFVLDDLWCRPGRPGAQPFGPFPTWLYESTDTEYLLRILSPASVEAAVKRVGIWLNLTSQTARADGYAPVFPRINHDAVRAKLTTLQADGGGPSSDEPYPALDLLSSHLDALPAGVSALFVFAPVYVNALPPPGSRAAGRLDICKDRVRRLAEQRARTGYLDLKTDNAMARKLDAYYNEVHYGLGVAHMVEDSIARALRDMR
jgi:hypothetical protein